MNLYMKMNIASEKIKFAANTQLGSSLLGLAFFFCSAWTSSSETSAENFRAFIFPKTTRNPDGSIASVDLSVALPNRRQDNVFETKDRYFCDNVLGLWIIAFTLYTQAGFNAAINPNDPNHGVLQAIADRNGKDRDGTPILQTVADIENLVSLGLVELRNNPLPGAGPPRPRWVI